MLQNPAAYFVLLIFAMPAFIGLAVAFFFWLLMPRNPFKRTNLLVDLALLKFLTGRH